MVLPLLAPGLQDIEEGLLFQFLPKSAIHRRPIVTIGIVIMVVALILASFATTAAQIVATQGILYGLGGILLNFVHVSVFSEWFEQKRGQAMGLIWLGFRLGGLAFPLICQWLLDKHGYEKTLRVLIAPMLALLAPSIFLLRGRYPASAAQMKPTQPPMSKMVALRTPTLPYYLLVAVLFATVTNVPMMFITRFAADLELDTTDRALALSLVFLGGLLGPYFVGRLSDNAFRPSLLGACALLTSLMHTLFWGFVKTKSGLFGYAIAVGTISGGWSLPWKAVCGTKRVRRIPQQHVRFLQRSISRKQRTFHSHPQYLQLLRRASNTFGRSRGRCVAQHRSRGSQGGIRNRQVSGMFWRAPLPFSTFLLRFRQPLIFYAGGMTMASGLLALTPVCLHHGRILWARR